MNEREAPSLDCRSFLRGYSDYRDGRIAAGAEAAMTAHMASCPSCRRYDRAVRRGVAVLREAPTPKPRPLDVAQVRLLARRAGRSPSLSTDPSEGAPEFC